MRAIWLLAGIALAGCAVGDSPELACQKRLVAASGDAPEGAPVVAMAGGAEANPFGNKAFAAIDRNGCTAEQVAMIDRLKTLTAELPGLLESNEQAGKAGAEAEHMAAFEKMNNALVELNARQRSARSDLARMMEQQ